MTDALLDQIAVRKILVASTAHVSEETRDWLNEQAQLALKTGAGAGAPRFASRDPWPAIPIMGGVYGWQFYAQELFDEALPAEVKALMTFARAHGADWVELDADGDEIEGLPTWEW